MKNALILITLLLSSIVWAQTGNIRGVVTDANDLPLEGANITIAGDSTHATFSDATGNFRLENVALGRQTVIISFTGYDPITIDDVDVITGKDVEASAKLSEKQTKLDEIVVGTGRQKDKPLNKLAAVSVRQFGIEEVTRYAGGRSDVARLATNFAGVSAPDDSRNDIVVRGNSPVGLLWRIEGIPVPSPNHFASLGTTGSPVSALNSNMLANSDFITSAFPAEYGNALGGVFDLTFRKGNKDNYEYMVSAGAFSGAEVMAEGPMLNKTGSFLVAGRFGLAAYFGAGGTSAAPNYKDLAFNFDFGKTKFGNFSLFAITGDSYIKFRGNDIEEDDLFAAEDEDSDVTSTFGVVGIKHSIPVGSRSQIKTTVGASIAENTVDISRIYNFETPEATKLKNSDISNNETRFTVSSYFNSRVTDNFTLRSGVLYERFTLDSKRISRERQSDLDGDGFPDYNTLIDSDDNYSIFQPYAQGQWKLFEKFTLNAGIHAQYFSINEEFAVEPRASLAYQINNNQSVSFGYGLHHQNVPAPILFLNENISGNLVQSNRDLDLVRSQHYVLGYDVRLANKWRTKFEVYYQSIDRAAVEAFPSSYSSLTEGADFSFSTDKTGLVSNGKGFNQGIEFTLEKFFSNGYYGLFTASVFEAKYEGSDGVERDSPFNNGYVMNVLGGKEFIVGRKKKNVFFFDTRFSLAGGKHYTPVDLAASQAADYEILQEERAFSQQYPTYFRADLKLGMKLNSSKKKVSHQFYVDLQNITNRKNVFAKQFNRLTQRVDQIDQLGFFPDFGYKLMF